MSIDKLQEKIRKLKNPSVIDLTVAEETIPPQLLAREGSVCGAYWHFSRDLMAGLKDLVPALRFSFSAFALYGSEGLAQLASALTCAREMGFYVLLDAPEALSAKAAEAAAERLLAQDCPWPCDALTVTAYIGSDAVKPYVNRLKGSDKSMFVTLRTANRTASELQDLLTGSRLVHMAMADMVSRLGEPLPGRSGYSRVAGLAAASSADSLRKLRSSYRNLFLLLDGYDYPNANAKNCSFAFDELGHGAAACAGLSVTGAWKEEGCDEATYTAHAVEAAERMKKNLTRYITVL